ncbi:carotenoid biosynthesis protein [Arthrobacter sp. Br18]|uniref:carotenoid biosynthesis protein n=1 Tax=Arthrobacter sp. Br18 TaxID=1312954 RepID=UPI0004B7043A|nr:carotenoid biosynthesis protein [Arthrobacter sp. Br18]
MPRTATPRPVPRLLIGACVFLFLSGYFVVKFPDVPGASVGSYVFNVLIALPAFVALWRQLGAVRAAAALVAVSLFGYLIEGFGVATGYPYGEFYYGEPLGPRAFDLVPFLLPLSYVPLVIGTVAVFAGAGRTLRRIIASALLLVVVDGVLDPGAVSLGFWVWPGGGPYYGVPLSNYGGWLISGLLASAILTAAGGRSFGRAGIRPGLLDSLIASLSLWLGVTIFSGLVFPAVLAAALIALLIARRAQLARALQDAM